ncbi:carboxypeptidase-like regulatory domain-containing protein [Clostridium sp. MSJ-4]|uniref:Carboxypeptidase-like regulatory domain-containing protein n=1 Tax=Clostridium simiarum TaxID=2841506 RepID=A0ABS6EVC4_9CLOT|nr:MULTISPECIES: hypothetical protein [Clostridium]MBU5590177.1 carboxypeptidase-like regulatory domain-containing protein [Clostridium simiarum]
MSTARLYSQNLSGFQPGVEYDYNITLEAETRSAIHGVVRLPNNTVAANAVVKLFKLINGVFEPIDFQYTDAEGQFLFGIADIGGTYRIKIYWYPLV